MCVFSVTHFAVVVIVLLLVLAIVVALCVRCALLNVLDVVAMSDCHAPATLKKNTLLNQIVCGYSSDYSRTKLSQTK